MKKIQIIRLIIGLLVLLTFSSAAFAADEWTSVRTKNFFLIGNAKEKEIRGVAVKLEQFREVLRLVLPKLNLNSAIPTTVVVFKSDKAYDPYRPISGNGKADRGIAGYFMPGDDINYITLSTENESNQTLTTIFHEYMHSLVDNNLGRGKVPSWFNEGLAEYYETFRMDGDQKAVLGDIQPWHLELFRQQKMMPLDALFNADYTAMHRRGGGGRSMYYAESWALVHYLMQGNKNRTPQMNVFISNLIGGKPPREAFQAAFQTDYATLEKELEKYVAQKNFTATGITFNDKLVVESEMRSAPISEAAALAYLGDLLLHSYRYDEAAVNLEKSIALDGNSALANAALGRIRVHQNRFGDAKILLEKALSLDDKNYLINYYYGETIFNEYVRPNELVNNIPTDAAEKIRASLKRTIELKPDYAEAYRMLAFVNLVNNENLDEAVAYLQKALSILPGNEQVAYILAQVYMRQKNYDAARRVGENLAAKSADPQLRASAQSLLKDIEMMRRQSEEFAAYQKRREEQTDTPPRLTRENSDESSPADEAAMEEARNRGMNEMLFQPDAGETRAAGYLSAITCKSGVIFTIRVGDKTLHLTKTEFDSLKLRSFSADSQNLSVGCDAIKKDYYVVVIYKAAPNQKTKTDGELMSLEFMPPEFKLIL